MASDETVGNGGPMALLSRLALAVVIAAAAAVALLGIDREIVYYDSGVYVATGKAIATGLGYANPNLPGNPPQGLYPPVVSLLWSVLWRLWPVFPDNIRLMKGAEFVFALGFLAVAYRWFRSGVQLPPILSVLGLALVAFHPLFVHFANELSSEIPYAVLSIAALLMYVRAVRFGSIKGEIAAGIVAGIALLTRTVGLALFAAFILDGVRRRRFRTAMVLAVIATAVFVPWSLWSWHAKAAYERYPQEIAINYRGYLVNLTVTGWAGRLLEALPINAINYLYQCLSWFVPWLSAVPALFVACVCILPVVRSVSRSPTVCDWYFGVSTLLIVLWPWPFNDRFVLVLSPLIVGYVLKGASLLIERASAGVPRRVAASAFAGIAICTVMSDLSSVRLALKEQRGQRMIWSQLHDAMNWINSRTPPSAIILTSHDPTVYLFSNRHTIDVAYPDPFLFVYRLGPEPSFANPSSTLLWLHKKQVCYILDDLLNGTFWSPFYSSMIDSLRRAASPPLEVPFANASFRIYRIPGCDKPTG